MIINNVNSSKFYSNSVAATRYSNPTGSVRGAQKFDSFMPSKEAQTFSEMLTKLKNIPDVRADRVSELEQQVSSGRYFVSADAIAAGLLTNRY